MALILLPIPNNPVNAVKVGCLLFNCVYTLLDKSVNRYIITIVIHHHEKFFKFLDFNQLPKLDVEALPLCTIAQQYLRIFDR